MSLMLTSRSNSRPYSSFSLKTYKIYIRSVLFSLIFEIYRLNIKILYHLTVEDSKFGESDGGSQKKKKTGEVGWSVASASHIVDRLMGTD